jgi:hypothetical protein
MNKIIIIVALIVIVAIVVGVVLMTTTKTTTSSTPTKTQSPSSTQTSGVKPAPASGSPPAYATKDEVTKIPLPASGTPPIAPPPVVIKEKKLIKDSGYPDGVKGDLKSGWYDIIGQGVANDYCRYVGDGAGFFACVLSTNGEQYTKEYNGKKVEDIARTAMKDACANTSDGNVSQDCYLSIWKQAGCTNSSGAIGNYNWAKGQSKASLINDSKAWATIADDNHRKGCYGDNKSSWPASYIRYSSRNNFMSY